MTDSKALDTAGKGADGEESLEDVLKNFKAVRNTILHRILFLLPWLILIVIIYILTNYRLRNRHRTTYSQISNQCLDFQGHYQQLKINF